MRPCAAPCLRPVVHFFRCPKKVASHVETWHPIGWVSIWFHLSMYTAAREGGRMNFKKTERSICLHRTRKWFGKTGKMRFHLPTSGSKGRYLHMIAAMSCRISTFPKWQKKRWNQRKWGYSHQTTFSSNQPKNETPHPNFKLSDPISICFQWTTWPTATETSYTDHRERERERASRFSEVHPCEAWQNPARIGM